MQTPDIHWLELKVPPPLIAVLLGAFIWWLSFWLPTSLALPFDTLYLALPVALLGLSCDLAGILSFYRAQTTVNPLKPGSTRALVISGIYSYTRNPMYLGLTCLLTAWVLYLGQWLLLPLVGLLVFYLNRFQIAPEEQALLRLFGDQYSAYQQRVRRWL